MSWWVNMNKSKDICIWEFFLRRKKVMSVPPDWMADRTENVIAILRGIGLPEFDQERVVVLAVDCDNRIRGMHTAHMGTMDTTVVHCREILRIAIMRGACGIILAHNHPTGDPLPSPGDMELTRRLVKTGSAAGIPLLDHIIFGNALPGQAEDYISLKDAGRLSE